MKCQSDSEIDTPSTMPRDLQLDCKPRTHSMVTRRTVNENLERTQPTTALYDLYVRGSHYVCVCAMCVGFAIKLEISGHRGWSVYFRILLTFCVTCIVLVCVVLFYFVVFFVLLYLIIIIIKI